MDIFGRGRRTLRDVFFNMLINFGPQTFFMINYIRPILARMTGMRVGAKNRFQKCFYYGPWNIQVGANVVIPNDGYIDAYGPVKIGDGVVFGARSMLITASHEIGTELHRCGEIDIQSITIGDGCWIGANVLIGPGVEIGSGCVISAGAVVMRSMPPNTLVAGNPARPVKQIDLPHD